MVRPPAIGAGGEPLAVAMASMVSDDETVIGPVNGGTGVGAVPLAVEQIVGPAVVSEIVTDCADVYALAVERTLRGRLSWGRDGDRVGRRGDGALYIAAAATVQRDGIDGFGRRNSHGIFVLRRVHRGGLSLA